MKPCHYQVVGNHHRPYLTRPFDFNTNCYQCADDTGSCADTFFCWHAQLSAQYSALTTGIPGPNAGYCLGLFCVDLCFGGLGSLVCLGMMRSKIRDLFGLSSTCSDCTADVLLIVCGCACCVACQNHREMHMRGLYPGGCCCTYPNPNFVRPPMVHSPMGGGVISSTTVVHSYPASSVTMMGPPPPPMYQPQPQMSASPPYGGGPVYGYSQTDYTNQNYQHNGGHDPYVYGYDNGAPAGPPMQGVPLQSKPYY